MTDNSGQFTITSATGYAGFDDHQSRPVTALSADLPLLLRVSTWLAHAAQLVLGALASLAAAAALVPLLRSRPGGTPPRSSQPGRPASRVRSELP